MTDRPIIFSSQMILALLAGRKTQTRRLAERSMTKRELADRSRLPPDVAPTLPSVWQLVKPGDTLWVREEFSGWWGHNKLPPRSWPAGSVIWYWADGNPEDGDWTRPKPSIHMPRWASRLTLTVTAVRVEPLQAITGTDARAEGITSRGPDTAVLRDNAATNPVARRRFDAFCVREFGKLWNILHGPGSWEANPAVVAITFTVERRNIDAQPHPSTNPPAGGLAGPSL